MGTKYKYYSPEIWGGIECTVNRIQDTYLDQLSLSRHYDRSADISLLVNLGIKKLRFPILWEVHQPQPDTEIDWRWAGRQLETLRRSSVQPIVGLVHHGSGPAFTNLEADNFASGLAEYAGKVATQFPWVEYYTPVNEPLTTARFSGLYGFWYPHKTNDRSFLRMLLNQLKATVLSMQEIRKVNPLAKLVQTEDLSKIYSTSNLAYQAEFENHRRWLTYDILCGKLNDSHPLWYFFINNGFGYEELLWFAENTCVPNVAGFNHYVTSERFLDHEIDRYPAFKQGGNGQHVYVDTEAIRVPHSFENGLEYLLTEAWERYKLPIALTEVHLHCTREEQMRWFNHAWKTAVKLAGTGIDIRAITAWSLLGAYGWNRLLTCDNGDYESGTFDLRSSSPRPTAMAKLIKGIATDTDFSHPLLSEEGWWKRDNRFVYHNSAEANETFSKSRKSRPLLILGKSGTLGRAFARLCEMRGINYRLLSRDDMDICNIEMIERAVARYRPWAIINAAGFVRVDDAESDSERCFNENTIGPELLASQCRTHGIKFVTFSSDLVFDGKKDHPYVESDKVAPLNIYGLSKARKEELVLKANSESLIIRTSAFFSPWDQHNFISLALNVLAAGDEFIAVNDVSVSPTYVPDLVNATLDLLIDDESNVWHLANEGAITWSDLAREAASRAKISTQRLIELPHGEMDWQAARPTYSVLKSTRGMLMPGLDNALERYFEHRPDSPLRMAV